MRMLAELFRPYRLFAGAALVGFGISLMNRVAEDAGEANELAERRRANAEEATQALAAHAEELRRVIASRQLVLDELDSGIDPDDQRL